MTLAKTAIIGIGATEQGEIPGQSADFLAARAAAKAIEDAGIDKSQIDGLITCKPPMSPAKVGTDENIGQMLGMNPAFASTLEYGPGAFSLHLADAAISAGLAHTVLVTYGTNLRSAGASFGGGTRDWLTLAGLVHIAGPAAMAARRHMHLYGTTEEQLGWVSVAQREWAQNNPIAVFREPMSIADYLASPYVVEPLRRPDLTMISDGGAAVIVTTAERAKDFKKPPVYVQAIAQQSAMRSDQNADKLMRPWIKDIGDRVYKQAGLGPKDMDLVYMQDATSVWVLQMLEWYGFCGIGEAGPFLAEGHTRPGGSLPVNTNGGQLSECYMWNWMHLYEAVRQLRKECGPRQIAKSEVALYAQTHDFYKGAASILSTHAG